MWFSLNARDASLSTYTFCFFSPGKNVSQYSRVLIRVMLLEVRLGSLQISSFSVAAELGTTRLQSVSDLASYHMEPECIMITIPGVDMDLESFLPPKGMYVYIYIYEGLAGPIPCPIWRITIPVCIFFLLFKVGIVSSTRLFFGGMYFNTNWNVMLLI